MRIADDVRRVSSFAVMVAAIACASAGERTDVAGPTPKPPSLLVVAPKSLADAVQPLVDHKNQTGLPARLVTIESLPRGPARDDAERVKRAIAATHESDGVKWVLLVGDASLFPVRYRQVRQVPPDAHVDCTYNPTDLYYANLYHDHAPGKSDAGPDAVTHGTEFDTWDADGDGAYDVQHWAPDTDRFNPDRVDGCPDVAVGRLPAHTPEEVAAYVAKVIRYETTRAESAVDERIACIADAGYGGSLDLSDAMLKRALARGFAGDVAVERFVMGWGDQPANPPPRLWRKGSFADVDAAIARDGWGVYVGHASPRRWEIRSESGRCYDWMHVKCLQNRESFPVVLAVGCESGRYMAWAPSAPYVDAAGHIHKFVYDESAKKWSDSGYDERKKQWTIREEIGPRLVVPPPSNYDLPESRDRTFACTWLFSLGGAIAYAGESLVCENDKGCDLVADVLAAHVGEGRILGDLWLEGQRRYWLDNRGTDDVFRNPRIYLAIMTLFGDPSLRLRREK